MTLAILPGACLDPNLKWSVPGDLQTKLPFLLSVSPKEGRRPLLDVPSVQCQRLPGPPLRLAQTLADWLLRLLMTSWDILVQNWEAAWRAPGAAGAATSSAASSGSTFLL